MKANRIIFVVGVLIVTLGCNLFTEVLNPADDIISEVEDLADQVDIEELEENMQTVVPELPTDLGDLQSTAEALAGGFESGEVPPDIPVVEGEKENMFASRDLVSYFTSMDYDDVLRFYQAEMPNNGWNEKKQGTVVTENAAVLNFKKQNRDVMVTLSINPLDGKTVVMITIQTK